jgi:hypothetical protein
MTIDLHLVLKLRMCGAIFPPSYTVLFERNDFNSATVITVHAVA